MTAIAQLELKIRSLLRRHIPRAAAPDLAYDPYDVEALRRISAQRLAEIRAAAPQAPEEQCRVILGAIQEGYPTPELADAYFAALELALSDKPRLDVPGHVVIGVGPGRCGSTSLSQMLATIANSCCTHEGPPMMFWRPLSEQIAFHTRRLDILSKYHSVVSDVSHWWLNAIDQVWERLPEAKVIGLVRNPEECANSFMRIQGFGKGSFNPWAPRGNAFWRAGLWDATYPSYSVPDLSKTDPDRVKLELITRYVREYNAQMAALAESRPDRVKLVKTDALSLPEVQDEIFAIAGHRGVSAAWKLNVKGVRDGKTNQIRI